MTTSIKNLFAAALTIITLSTSAFAATDVNEKNVTILNQVKNINKLVVNGNVEVILVQAPTESVKVYDSYYSKNALVQQENGVLRISSFQKEVLSVTVYVRNLSAIEVSNSSSVKTYGKVSFLTLDVILKDNATADINATTLELSTIVKDNASLKLSGTAEEHYALLGSQAKLSMDRFIAECGYVNSSRPVIAKVEVKKAKTNALPASDDFVEISK
jgi:hypothetical protein